MFNSNCLIQYSGDLRKGLQKKYEKSYKWAFPVKSVNSSTVLGTVRCLSAKTILECYTRYVLDFQGCHVTCSKNKTHDSATTEMYLEEFVGNQLTLKMLSNLKFKNQFLRLIDSQCLYHLQYFVTVVSIENRS